RIQLQAGNGNSDQRAQQYTKMSQNTRKTKMRNFRKFSLLALTSLLLLGALGTIAACQGWWAFSLTSLFITLFAMTLIILYCTRALLHQVRTAQRQFTEHLEMKTGSAAKTNEINFKNSEKAKSELKRIKNTQEESLIILESKINNVSTQIQKHLDTTKRQNDISN